MSLFCYAILGVHSSFVIILKSKRKLVALLLLSCRRIVTVNVLWLFLTVPWVGLQCAIVVFPDHTLLLFVCIRSGKNAFLTLPRYTIVVLHDIMTCMHISKEYNEKSRR